MAFPEGFEDQLRVFGYISLSKIVLTLVTRKENQAQGNPQLERMGVVIHISKGKMKNMRSSLQQHHQWPVGSVYLKRLGCLGVK